MKTARNRARCRVIAVFLAITWLPCISTRCVAGCRLGHGGAGHALPAASEGHAHSDGARGHLHHGHESVPSRAGDPDHGRTPERTCCESTGTHAFTVPASPAPPADPLTTAVTLPIAIDVAGSPVTLRQHRPTPDLAHDPPVYLRHATLRI